jgi:hypothetical protein
MSAPTDISRGRAIQPSSGLWRAAIILLMGALIILGLLFFQGKWDSAKRRTEIYPFQVTSKENEKIKISTGTYFFNLGTF